MPRTRRHFLQSALGSSTLLTLAPTVPAFLARTALAAAPCRDQGDTILVLVELAGGNDGLNAVVPYADDAYARSRPTIRLDASQLHKIDADLGFHPRMAAFHRLYQEGHLAVVQGVGYPNTNDDHEVAIRDWHTARPGDTYCQTGWAGRALDHVYRPDEGRVLGVSVGPERRPLALNAEKVPALAVRSLDQWRPQGAGVAGRDAGPGPAEPLAEEPGAEARLLDFVTHVTVAAYADSRRVEAVASGPTADYPSYQLAQRLRTIAQLIRAGAGIRLYYAKLGGDGFGGFDNHANQIGNHCALLEELAESVAAFVADLKSHGQLDRVLLATFSEFGRTVRENGRRGTDHGGAAPVFLAGGRLRGGLAGEHPPLTDVARNALTESIDFRRVYATFLDRWLGFESEPIIGPGFDPLELV